MRSRQQLRKEKKIVTEQSESQSEAEEILQALTVKGEPIMLKEYKVVVEDLLCDTQERNDIQNEDQNNVNKNDGFIAKNFDEISKMKEDIINELSNVRHTEIKER